MGLNKWLRFTITAFISTMNTPILPADLVFYYLFTFVMQSAGNIKFSYFLCMSSDLI